jgi:hypothetical protein
MKEKMLRCDCDDDDVMMDDGMMDDGSFFGVYLR